MSIKIRISYTDECEANMITSLLKPIQGLFKIKKSAGSQYKYIYYSPKNIEK